MERKLENQPKVCKGGLNKIWVDFHTGDVRICGWTNYYIGNLIDNTIEELWKGESAQLFRESLLDGSYRYCSRTDCPNFANNRMDEMLVDYVVPELPESCNLSYQLQCNYACKFCRKDHYVPCDCEKENYVKIEKEVKKMLPTLRQLGSNGRGEFFCSDSIIKLIEHEELNPDMAISIETNGSLFNEENWKRIEKLGKHKLSVSITVQSLVESTYQFLTGTNLPMSQLINNLKFVSKLRDQGIINGLTFATVVCERNFREMPEFVRTCLNEFSMDKIRLRFFQPYGVMDLTTEWFYDVRNEFHPYHDEFVKVMKDPIFQNEKVWKWQGETKSEQGENPYILEKRKSDALSKLVLLPNARELLQKFMAEKGNPHIALYGASYIGKAYRKLLSDYGIQIDMIFDTSAECTDEEGYKIRRPSDTLVNQYDLILITTDPFVRSITRYLKRNKYKGEISSMSSLISDLRQEN